MEPLNLHSKFKTNKTGEEMPHFVLKEAKPLEDGSLFDENNNTTLTPKDKNNDGIIDSQIMEILDKNTLYSYIDDNNDGIIDVYKEIKYDEKGEITEEYREYHNGVKQHKIHTNTNYGKSTEYFELEDKIQTHITELEFENGEKYYDINEDGLPDATEYSKAKELATEINKIQAESEVFKAEAKTTAEDAPNPIPTSAPNTASSPTTDEYNTTECKKPDTNNNEADFKNEETPNNT